ncbi:SLATT domain-containing protein [Streptomyces melanogenes]|uniref:SLATT domain-containing protein n=1 Tax=Streptomyces melanogenes TaxID=67326 RepID=UPI0019B35E83|nr:SLATT domain-containing protein [Streptomyces melanogenes]GGP93274.1 hypothetical protein GCM10010278_84050 [Streptomyces melanogenes]
MARDIDDDSPRRHQDAYDHVRRSLREESDSEGDDATLTAANFTGTPLEQMINWGQLQVDVSALERKLARARSVVRVRRIAFTIAGLVFAVGISWTALNWRTPSRIVLLTPGILCALVSGLCIAVALVDTRLRKPEPLATLEDDLALLRLTERVMNATHPPSLMLRRNIYREDVASLVEQYETDSLRYRRTHNRLQTLIMIGSASTTTIAALDTGKELTWQSVSVTGISFAITVAAMFTGYYKFRERSYFLQQTADAIQEEANAVRLGIGAYSEYGPGQEGEALKLFTERVEQHRNEQRRRQQQLDQPADQSAPSSQPPTV